MIEGNLITTKPGIYYFRNQTNNKYYIGQAVNLRVRFKSHIGNYKNNRYDNPLYRAFNKYGLDNFDYDLLEIIEDELDNVTLKELLDKLEKEYINKYDSYNNGYNQTLGGDFGILGYKFTEEQLKAHKERGRKVAEDGRYKIFVYDKQEDIYYEFLNLTEASEKLNLNVGGLRTAKSKHRLYLNRYFSEVSKELIQQYLNARKETTVNSSNSNDYLLEYYNYLKQFESISITQVSQDLNIGEEAVKKRNQKLRKLGYTDLPFNSRPSIKAVKLIDTINNTESYHTIEDLSEMFGIKVSAVRKQIQRTNLYKKQYLFEIIYEQ